MELQHIPDTTRNTEAMVDRRIETWDVPVQADDDANLRRKKLRGYVKRFRGKGLPPIYIEEAKEVTGQDGVFRKGVNTGWTWGVSVWPDSPSGTSPDEMVWPKFDAGTDIFIVFFEPKTAVSQELDDVQARFRQDHLLPAFHKIFLVDASDVILREV